MRNKTEGPIQAIVGMRITAINVVAPDRNSTTQFTPYTEYVLEDGCRIEVDFDIPVNSLRIVMPQEAIENLSDREFGGG